MKILHRLLPVLAFVSIITFGSVFAVWIYPNPYVPEVTDEAGVGITVWIFDSEEILPDDTQLGESHLDLMTGLLGEHPGMNKNHSINGKDAIEKAVKAQTVLYWFENISGTNLKHTFFTEASKEIEFVLEYVSETDEINLYTYHSEDLYQVDVNSTPIQVYKTILAQVDGEWHDIGSIEGHAVVTVYPGGSQLVIDPANFQPGKVDHIPHA